MGDRRRHLVLALAAGVALFLLSDNVNAFTDQQLANIGLFAIVLAGLTVLTGLNGQLSLGHGALMAIGAYTTALLLAHTQMPMAVVLLGAVAVTAGAGVIVGLAAARLRGPYLAGATLALAVGLPDVANQYPHTLGADQGLVVPPLSPPAWLGPHFTPQRWLAWVSLAVGLVVLVLLANLSSGRLGRSFKAVRDDEVAAALAGVAVARTQVTAFVVSAACAGLGGGLLALAVGQVGSGGFPLSLSLSLLAGIVLGGLGSLLGAVWGAVVLVYLNEVATSAATHLGLSATTAPNLALVIYGVVLIGVMLVFPAGIQGGVRRLSALVGQLGHRVVAPRADGFWRRKGVP
ncbi:MAG: branched-chain amino acid ABC transporter permease [Acidimicrobiales bacterium]|nr:MAG: branched-chain amino acid ABC transporter permease [Acidimicrobiales bacterium]